MKKAPMKDKSELTLGFIGFGMEPADEIEPFDKIFKYKLNLLAEKAFEHVDAILLWGGKDVHPSIYNQKMNIKNQCYPNDIKPSERDQIEWHIMREALKHKKMIIGVCRGAQFTCVFAGGSLYQDVEKHDRGHRLQTYDGKVFYASAGHHQMMNLDGTKHELLAWPYEVQTLEKNTTMLSSYHERETVGENKPGKHLIDSGKEPEVVWFPEIRGMAIQPHPEWRPASQPAFVDFICKEITERL